MDNYIHSRFHALGDPTRLAVVERLLKSPASVSELARPHSMALPAFMKHLAVLEDAGLISSRKSGRVRTCTINPQSLRDLDRWFRGHRPMWEGRLERLSQHLDDNQET